MNRAEKKQRLSRDTWLQQALEILAEDPEHLRIDELADRLGVSKGSFYWHFENRSDFVLALAEYWRDENTKAVAGAIALSGGSAEERLHVLMRFLLENNSSQYDLPVRAWARHEPDILPVIREVDEIRTMTVRKLFEEMGFAEPDISVRTHLFVTYHSFDSALTSETSSDEALAQLDALHAFFTRR